MAKRYIGIELDGGIARVVLLSEESGDLSLTLRKQEYSSAEEAREALTELTEGAGGLGDHLVTALPAGAGFFRNLVFPFRERSKLEAVLRAELDSQVPVSLENYTCAMLPAREAEGGYRVAAAAVSNQAIEDLLEHFPAPDQQPRRIDLLPHGLVAGLGGRDGLLVYCGSRETLVTLVLDGQTVEFRLLPTGDGTDEEQIGRFVIAQLAQLEQLAGRRDLPVWIGGAQVTDKLLSFWQAAGRVPDDPDLPLEQNVPAEFLPVVLLALSEKGANRQSGFNFRTGPYAPQGQLEQLKKKLAAVVVLALLCLLVLGGSAFFTYQQKARQADLLKQQLEEVFRQTMPANAAIVDVPLQMQSHLKELRQQALLLGIGGQVTALNSLESLSSMISPDLRNDIKELSYNGEQVRLDGYTDSFEAVNRITQFLNKSPLFSFVEISEARMAADGSRVDFQLKIDLIESGGSL